jgi:hypothetical protein
MASIVTYGCLDGKGAFKTKPAAVSRSFEENAMGSSLQLHLPLR